MKQREIKFRAWIKDKDIPEGHIVEGTDNLFISTRKGELVIENYEGKVNRYKEEQYILMQYTGLKDKNGKEIYEGDIVEHQIPVLGTDRKEVIWDKIGFTLKGYKSELNNPMATFKVIGNIYENPELCK